MSEKEYFKIAWRAPNGTYRSFSPAYAELSLTYRIGEVTLPRVGGILVFETKEDVLRFIPEGHFNAYPTRLSVLRGVAGGTCYLPPGQVPDYLFREMEEIRDFWTEDHRQKWKPLVFVPWPEGTVAVQSFKPLEDLNIS